MLYIRIDWSILEHAAIRGGLSPCRAMFVSDHGAEEPFLVRKLGPLLHGDFAEALEDALQRPGNPRRKTAPR